MIRTLADDTTKDISNGVNSKAARRIIRAIWPIIQRKLDQIDSVVSVGQLRVPPMSFQRLNAIIKGRRGVSADTALLLEALTNPLGRSDLADAAG